MKVNGIRACKTFLVVAEACVAIFRPAQDFKRSSWFPAEGALISASAAHHSGKGCVCVCVCARACVFVWCGGGGGAGSVTLKHLVWKLKHLVWKLKHLVWKLKHLVWTGLMVTTVFQ